MQNRTPATLSNDNQNEFLTDNADIDAEALVDAIGTYIQKNYANTHNKYFSIFDGVRPAGITVVEYLQRLKMYLGTYAAKISPPHLIVMLIYLARFMEKTHIIITPTNVHRLIATSIVLAFKWIEDVGMLNAYSARLAGLPVKELNQLEIFFLEKLDFNLYVSEDNFKLQIKEIEESDTFKEAVKRHPKILHSQLTFFKPIPETKNEIMAKNKDDNVPMEDVLTSKVKTAIAITPSFSKLKLSDSPN